MAPVTFITPTELSTKLRSPPPLPIVVDVRDADYAGGHIRGSVHVPAHTFKRDVAAYARRWADKRLVVFHCMMSQVRGPSCAQAFAQQLGEEGEEGEEDGQGERERRQVEKGPRVAVLRGGFSGFARMYSQENKDLFEAFDTRMYGAEWERD